MPPVTPRRTRSLRLIVPYTDRGAGGRIRSGRSVDARRDGLLLFGLGLGGLFLRRRAVTPVDHVGLDLVHGDAGGLLLAGFDLRAGAAHQLLGAARGEQ